MKLCFLDVNECNNGENDCDDPEKAFCCNTVGYFKCYCKTGFTGDGKNCTGSVIFLTTYCSHRINNLKKS